jgi:DNA-binding transcriptional LysR family regulator
VAEHRSFTKAAELAGLTQSAVTRQMQGIEESLGVALFERTTRSVHLTPAGQMLRAESSRWVIWLRPCTVSSKRRAR